MNRTGILSGGDVVTRHELIHRIRGIAEVLLENLREDYPEIGICGQVAVVYREQCSCLPGRRIAVVDSSHDRATCHEHGGTGAVVRSLGTVFDGGATKLGDGHHDGVFPHVL